MASKPFSILVGEVKNGKKMFFSLVIYVLLNNLLLNLWKYIMRINILKKIGKILNLLMKNKLKIKLK